MTDQELAGGNEGEGDYRSIWDEVAREEAGQAPEAPQADERHDHPGDEEKPADKGQPPSEERPQPDAERPAGSETDDPWKDAPANLREAYEAERKEREKAQNLIKSNQGRWSSAQRELAEVRSRQPAPAQPQAAPAPNPARSGELDAELKRVEEEYPDIAKPFIGLIADLRSELDAVKQDASRRGEIEAKQSELATQERLAREEQVLAEAHDDWLDQVKSQAFADWANAQPRMVQEALQRNGNGIVDGAEASKILSDFKRDTGIAAAPSPLADRRAAQLEGSRHVPPKVPAMRAKDGSSGSYDDEWKLAREEEERAAKRK